MLSPRTSPPYVQMYVAELDRIVLKDSITKRPFSSTQTCRKTAVTTRILGLVHQLCTKQVRRGLLAPPKCLHGSLNRSILPI